MKLSDIVKPINVKNSNNEDYILLGLNCNKEFMPSIANTIGTDLSKYKIIKKGQFACSLMQVARDGLVPICRLADYEFAIMSSAYSIFEVFNENVNPDYLMCFFRTQRFDDNAMFFSAGGIRGALSWERFLDIDVPIPSLEEQNNFVNNYNSICNLIATKEAINNNLFDYGITLFNNYQQKINICDNIELRNLIKFIKGKNPEELFFENAKGRVRYLNLDAFSINSLTYVEEKNTTFLNKQDFLMVMDGSSSGKVIFGKEGVAASTLSYIKILSDELKYIILFKLKSIESLHKVSNTGSAIPHANKEMVFSQIIKIDDQSDLYNNIFKQIVDRIIMNYDEIDYLQNMKKTILSRF